VCVECGAFSYLVKRLGGFENAKSLCVVNCYPLLHGRGIRCVKLVRLREDVRRKAHPKSFDSWCRLSYPITPMFDVSYKHVGSLDVLPFSSAKTSNNLLVTRSLSPTSTTPYASLACLNTSSSQPPPTSTLP
jgi:hypothetical protein